MREPAEIAEDVEWGSELPQGSEERFYGYAVMGIPFRSGHVLGLRRIPVSSIGPGYRSVWHPIRLAWSGPRSLRVSAGDGDLEWTLDVGSTPVTRLFNAVGAALPTRAWRSRPVLAVMSGVAGGRVRLTGLTPNGHRFVANPLIMWVVTSSRAVVRGIDLGQIGSAPRQAQLRDFALPQRGMLVVGRTLFT